MAELLRMNSQFSGQQDDTPKEGSVGGTLFVIGILLTVIQQMPIIRDVAYNGIRFALYCLFGTMLLFCFYKKPFARLPYLVKIFSLSIFVSCVLVLSMHVLNGGVDITRSIGTFTEMLIPFGILLISLNIEYTNDQIKAVVWAYILIVTIMGIGLVFFYGKTWLITTRYFLESKNQIGPILSITAVISFMLVIERNKSSSIAVKTIALVLLSVNGMMLLIIRSRSALLAFMTIASLILVGRLLEKKRIQGHMVLVVILIFVYSLAIMGRTGRLIRPVYNAFTLNYETGNIESLSAGRASVYVDSVEFLHDNPFWGDFYLLNKFPRIPHNYVLNKGVKYGVIGSLPILLFYFYMWGFLVSHLFRRRYERCKWKRNKSLVFMGPLVMMIPMIISLFEYSAPYGPGVSQVMAWFLLGQYLREEKTTVVKKL